MEMRSAYFYGLLLAIINNVCKHTLPVVKVTIRLAKLIGWRSVTALIQHYTMHASGVRSGVAPGAGC